ncbi:MAG: ABC transporter ATP-binding protein [Acidisphaera sp.]|nr:ABC transporter ATP-binding protein [Acidisphaera sp.]
MPDTARGKLDLGNGVSIGNLTQWQTSLDPSLTPERLGLGARTQSDRSRLSRWFSKQGNGYNTLRRRLRQGVHEGSAVPADIELRRISKRYGTGVVAADEFSLRILPGELISLLGPSGCGKTTMLRIIAGFVMPDAGSVLFSDADVTDAPANRRDVGMLFQSYALFPHMTVEANIAYGLRMRGVTKPEIRRRVEQVLEQVRLDGMGQRYPRQLSGGQQQRVALARAIIIRPSALLLDEPLSNLDANLRHEMRAEIRQIQQRLGITTIFVTHDQEEALTISDRIVVMNRGRAEQIGSPVDIYRTPKSLFVAQFIGEANIFRGSILGRTERGTRSFALDDLRLEVENTAAPDGSTAAILVRPESVHVFAPEDSRGEAYPNRFPATIEAAFYLGPSVSLRIRIARNVLLHVTQPAESLGSTLSSYVPRQGDAVMVAWQATASRLIPSS